MPKAMRTDLVDIKKLAQAVKPREARRAATRNRKAIKSPSNARSRRLGDSRELAQARELCDD